MRVLPNLKQLRRSRGISQQKLANLLDVSQQSINQYENHSVEPDIATLSRMAAFFETSIDYIVGRTTVSRNAENAEAFYLDEEEAELIQNYRTLNNKERKCVKMMVETLIER